MFSSCRQVSDRRQLLIVSDFGLQLPIVFIAVRCVRKYLHTSSSEGSNMEMRLPRFPMPIDGHACPRGLIITTTNSIPIRHREKRVSLRSSPRLPIGISSYSASRSRNYPQYIVVVEVIASRRMTHVRRRASKRPLCDFVLTLVLYLYYTTRTSHRRSAWGTYLRFRATGVIVSKMPIGWSYCSVFYYFIYF